MNCQKCIGHTIGVIDPCLQQDRANAIDNYDGVVVDSSYGLDQGILEVILSVAKHAAIASTYTIVPGFEVVAVSCVSFNGDVPLSER